MIVKLRRKKLYQVFPAMYVTAFIAVNSLNLNKMFDSLGKIYPLITDDYARLQVLCQVKACLNRGHCLTFLYRYE